MPSGADKSVFFLFCFFNSCGAFRDKYPVVFTLSWVTESKQNIISQKKGVDEKQMQSYRAISGSVFVSQTLEGCTNYLRFTQWPCRLIP